MRILLTIVVYIASLAFVAAVSFFAVIFLAGPHAGLLPNWLEAVVLILGWLAVIVVPLLSARYAWRRLKRSKRA